MATAHLGNHLTLKLIQLIAPVQKCNDTLELQRRDFGYFETHDNLEVGMGGIQRPIEEDGMEYGRHSLDEC